MSGWTGKNIGKGALGDFIFAAKAGKIPKGYGADGGKFDRFSRLKPRKVYEKVGGGHRGGRGHRDVGRWKISHKGNH